MIIYIAQYNYNGPSITSYENKKETDCFWYLDEDTKKYLLGRSSYIGHRIPKKPHASADEFPFLTFGDAINWLMKQIDHDRSACEHKLRKVSEYEKMVISYKEEK